jgi:hypothetical protein
MLTAKEKKSCHNIHHNDKKKYILQYSQEASNGQRRQEKQQYSFISLFFYLSLL